jgi:hypothetical protein
MKHGAEPSANEEAQHGGRRLSQQAAPLHNAIDAWIDAIPEDAYAPCPCGCGMKWRFAVQDGIEKHEQRFIEQRTEETA